MQSHLYQLLTAEISGENARNLAEDIWRFDRTSSFDDYARSAEYCRDALRHAGAEAERITFPATGKARYGLFRLQQAWDGTDAELHLLSPSEQAGRLLSYRDNPYVLCRGSRATPPEGIEAEVVVLQGGSKEADYKRTSVSGKIILTDQAPAAVHKLAAKHGAVGILTDHMATNPLTRPTPMDLPDAHLWLTMPTEAKLFAFVLSPREGRHLRDLVAQQSKKKKAVRVRATVEARTYDGHFNLVSAAISGRDSDREVALIAHLHEPGCNDNASGAAVCIEIVRALNALIEAGKLPRPRRTIRVWLGHEFTSLQALAHEQPEAMERVIAAANVDFVGQNQALCGSHMMYQTGPDALPSFINHIMVDLVDRFRHTLYTWGNDSSREPYFATLQTPFWMNDNFISDPSIGVPSVAFIQWPDRFYHTDHDTPDKLDNRSLARVAALAGCFVYLLADAGLPEALRFADIVADRSAELLRLAVEKQLDTIAAQARKARETPEDDNKSADPARDVADAWAELHQKIDYLLDRQLVALDSLSVLLSDDEQTQAEDHLADARTQIRQAAQLWHRRTDQRMEALADRYGLDVSGPTADRPLTPTEKKADAIVPYRKKRGIVTTTELPQKVQDALKKATKDGSPRLMLYWIDGKRSLLDICRLTKLEADGKPITPARAIAWAETMKQGGVIGFRKSRKG